MRTVLVALDQETPLARRSGGDEEKTAFSNRVHAANEKRRH